MVPHALLTVSLATAALPRLSRLAADRRLRAMQRDLVSTMRLAVAGVTLAGVLLLVLAIPLSRVLFGWGAGAGDTDVLGFTLMMFVPGLIAFTVHFLTLRGFYALEDTKTPFLVQCAVAATNVGVALVLVLLLPVVGSVGLAASFSVAYTVGALRSPRPPWLDGSVGCPARSSYGSWCARSWRPHRRRWRHSPGCTSRPRSSVPMGAARRRWRRSGSVEVSRSSPTSRPPGCSGSARSPR